MTPLLQHTKENYKVVVYQILTDDSSIVNFNACVKAFYMASDVRFHLPVENYSTDMESGEIVIFDMKNLTFKHLTHIVISTLRLFLKYLQDAHPVRIIQVNIVNCTPIIQKAMMMIKPFMYERLYNALKFHNAGSFESLYEIVPREILPSDFGGPSQSLAELKAYWTQVLHDHRDFLMDDDYFALKNAETSTAQSYRGIFSFLSS